jgi:hypothetical protein
LLRDGKAYTMASARLDPLLLSTNLADARVLADRRGATLNRIVPKGRTDWRAYVEETKTSGAVQQFIERRGAAGVRIARGSFRGSYTNTRCRVVPAGPASP